MNQILTIKNNKEKKSKEKNDNSRKASVGNILRFFSISIMTFGIILISKGSYALYREKETMDVKNMPKIIIGRINDKAIINVEHISEISRIIYSWNEGEETVLPEGKNVVKEEILLPNQNSILNIVIEDMQGQKIEYQKEYLLIGKDITKPSIEIETEEGNKKMEIIAKDESSISYLSYKWEGEEPITIKADSMDQKEITHEINLTPGTKNIDIIAKDNNGNIEKINKKIVATTSKPKMQLLKDGAKIYFEVFDDDGIKDIKINFNGKILTAENINLKAAKITIPEELKKGKNTISAEVTNISGYTEKAATEIEY